MMIFILISVIFIIVLYLSSFFLFHVFHFKRLDWLRGICEYTGVQSCYRGNLWQLPQEFLQQYPHKGRSNRRLFPTPAPPGRQEMVGAHVPVRVSFKHPNVFDHDSIMIPSWFQPQFVLNGLHKFLWRVYCIHLINSATKNDSWHWNYSVIMIVVCLVLRQASANMFLLNICMNGFSSFFFLLSYQILTIWGPWGL